MRKNETLEHMLSSGFCEIFKSTFSEHVRKTASKSSHCKMK